jgi:glycosyltransferase involved in cell wall biosynthesis
MYLSVVVPAYNESDNISVVAQNLSSVLSGISGLSQYEIIFCDDHSSDGSISTVVALKDDRIRAIRLSKRSGSHVAIRAGLKAAKGDMVLCISADGQEDPTVLTEMVDKINAGADIVWGVRTERKESFFVKQFGLLFYRLLKFFVENSNQIDLAHADFYLLNRKVVDAINRCKERNTSLFGLIVWIGFKQEQVRYERRERMNGKSKWSFRSRLRLATDWILAFSGIPLKLITILGVLFALAGFIYALIIVILFLTGNTTPGWSETVILILLLGGIQMTMIGVIGEYLWRTLDETRDRPLYFIEEETQPNNNHA